MYLVIYQGLIGRAYACVTLPSYLSLVQSTGT